MPRYLVMTRWQCRDNGKLLSIYRPHVHCVATPKAARDLERAHNATRTEMREEGWRSKIVSTVDIDTLYYESVAKSYEPCDEERIVELLNRSRNHHKNKIVLAPREQREADAAHVDLLDAHGGAPPVGKPHIPICAHPYREGTVIEAMEDHYPDSGHKVDVGDRGILFFGLNVNRMYVRWDKPAECVAIDDKGVACFAFKVISAPGRK